MKRHTMIPREHGAYAQLGLPLVAALAASRPSLAGACLALGACAAFVAHEPALVLLGHRGTRAKREASVTAKKWLAGALAVAAALGAAGLALSTPARTAALLPVALAVATAALVLRHEERSLLGQTVASAALASAAVPVAVAGGLAWADALGAWAVFCAAFAVSTVEVRAIARRDAPRAARFAAWALACGVVAALGARRSLLALAPVPVIVAVGVAAARSTSPSALRRLGWMLVASTLATAAAVVLALRVGA